jgi:hypothetical protein
MVCVLEKCVYYNVLTGSLSIIQVNFMLQIVNLRLLSMKAQGFMLYDLPALIVFWHVETSTGGTYEDQTPVLEVFPTVDSVNSA